MDIHVRSWLLLAACCTLTSAQSCSTWDISVTTDDDPYSGDKFTMVCNYTCSVCLYLTWRRGTEEVYIHDFTDPSLSGPTENFTGIVSGEEKSGTHELTLLEVEMQDSGNWSCSVTAFQCSNKPGFVVDINVKKRGALSTNIIPGEKTPLMNDLFVCTVESKPKCEDLTITGVSSISDETCTIDQYGVYSCNKSGVFLPGGVIFKDINCFCLYEDETSYPAGFSKSGRSSYIRLYTFWYPVIVFSCLAVVAITGVVIYAKAFKGRGNSGTRG